MKKTKTTMLTLGYGPAGPSSPNEIWPFDVLFDMSIPLYTKGADLDSCDAIVIWGGGDISPSLYGSERIHNSGPKEPSPRDLLEWHLIREAYERKIPMIGVCRGAQLMCAFAGGKLIQHVNGHNGSPHPIQTYDGKTFLMNSYHHQMMYPYDVKHELLAWCEQPLSNVYLPDNTVESAKLFTKQVKEPEVVYYPQINAMTVQGHPEWLTVGNPFHDWFMDQIMEKCFTKMEAKV